MKIAVIGTGITGRALVDFCIKNSIKVWVYDKKEIDKDYKDFLFENGIIFKERLYDEAILNNVDFVVISPSVRPEELPCKKEKIISELDFAQLFYKGKVVAVTGTNGKTTTVSLINHILSCAGFNSEVAGNIGVPFISVVDRSLDWIVLEVSSFQLYGSRFFKPDLAAILNIKIDHLDWHKDFNEYVQAKISIGSRQQANQVIFLNRADPLIYKNKDLMKAKMIWFEESDKLNENLACAKEITAFLGVGDSVFVSAVRDFKAPKYRMELVGSYNGIIFINDSKATNVASTVWALRRLSSYIGKVILLCGGSYKGDDFSVIGQWDSLIKCIYAYGQEAKRIEGVLSDRISVVRCDLLREAFDLALEVADPGDVVLFSPMCASFDQYRDYKERGKEFERLVQNYIRNN